MSDAEADDLRVVIPKHVVTKTTDDRGRVNLGSDFGDREVTVAVLEIHD